MPDLFVFFLWICGQRVTEFLDAGFFGQLIPVNVTVINTLLYQWRGKSFLAQLLLYSRGAVQFFNKLLKKISE